MHYLCLLADEQSFKIEETKIGDYLLTIYFLKADMWTDNDSDDDYYDGDFDEPPTPDFGMDDWYPNDEW